MQWRRIDDFSEELTDTDGHVLARFGPNPYGLMGQDWYRGWTFDPVTTKVTSTTVWRPQTDAHEMRSALEKDVFRT